MRNYIHIFKDNKEINNVLITNRYELIKLNKKYSDCILRYEHKKDFMLSDNCKCYLYPSDYEKLKNDLFNIYNILHNSLTDALNIDFIDVSNGYISISITHKSRPEYYVIIGHIDFDLKDTQSIIKLIQEQWNNIDMKLFSKIMTEGEQYGMD